MKYSKSIVAASLLLLSSMSAMAAAPAPLSASLSFSGGQVSPLTGIGFDTGSWLSGIAPAYDLNTMQMGGELRLSRESELTYTFVGKEATYNNFFRTSGRGNTFTNNGSALGSSFQIENNSQGALDFSFQSNSKGDFYENGRRAMGVILAKDKMSALILFNDSYSPSKKSKVGDADFDDMVVRVAVSPVPEPETYAMMLAGLGLMGAVARRRSKAKPA